MYYKKQALIIFLALSSTQHLNATNYLDRYKNYLIQAFSFAAVTLLLYKTYTWLYDTFPTIINKNTNTKPMPAATTTTPNDNTQLIDAVRKNNIKTVKTLLTNTETDPNIQDNDGCTALIFAVHHNNVEIVQLLLANTKTNPNIKDNDGCTALIFAVFKKDADIAQLLLANPETDPNIQDNDGKTALMWAVENNREKNIQQLLTNTKTNIKTDPNIKNNDGKTALILAANKYYADIAQLLLTNPTTDPNIKDNDGKTALMWAMENKNIDIVQLLLDNAKTDPNIQDNDGNTALMVAVIKNHEAIIQRLLTNTKTNPNIKNNKGKTALMVAIDQYNIKKVQRLLTNTKTDPNIQDNDGNTALMLAVHNKDVDIVQKLLANTKTDPNIQRNGNDTALMVAVINEDMDIVQKLLANTKTDPNIQRNGNDTALILAVKHNKFVRTAQLLLANTKTDPNIKGFDGNTALMVAILKFISRLTNYANKDWLLMLKILLNYGADSTIKNKYDKNVFNIITNNNEKELKFTQLSKLLKLSVDDFITQFNQIEESKRPYYAVNQLIINGRLNKHNQHVKLHETDLKKLVTSCPKYIKEKALFSLTDECIDIYINESTKNMTIDKKKDFIKKMFITACTVNGPNSGYLFTKLIAQSRSYSDMQETLKTAYKATNHENIKDKIRTLVKLYTVNKESKNNLSLTHKNLNVTLSKDIVSEIISY